MSNQPIMVVGGGLAVLVLLLAASTASAASPPSGGASAAGDWRLKVLRSISKHEGQPWSVQRNKDGAGVSWGIIQWTQAGGGLYVVLNELAARLPGPMAAVFGGQEALARLLAFTKTRSLAALDGAVLWDSPWLDRFVAAGRDERIAAEQWKIALASDYIQAIPKIGALLGLRSERAYALIGNRTVHQGVAGATRAATKLAGFYDEKGWPSDERTRLVAYAWVCASTFRGDTLPNNPRLTWKAVEEEHDLSPTGELVTVRRHAFHAFSGPWDLYELIVRRSAELLADPQWSDAPVRELVA